MEIRDQGYTRPKVLILVPFRSAALHVMETLMDLSGTTQQENKKRLRKEFGVDAEEEQEEQEDGEGNASADLKKPLDYQQTFKGNIDDCFRVGIKFSRKTMKLYADFYSSDILVASPLGLRMIIGSKGYATGWLRVLMRVCVCVCVCVRLSIHPFIHPIHPTIIAPQ